MDHAGRRERYFALEQEYAECGRKEAKLREELATLNARKQAIRVEQSLLAPIQILCDDVLAQIFKLGWADEHRDCWADWKKPSSLATTSFVGSVIRTCRRFRVVAFSLPDLWRCIHLSDDCATPSQVAMESYLSLSKNFMLQIIVKIGITSVPSAGEALSPCVDPSLEAQKLVSFQHSWDVIRTAVRRWENLSICARSKPEFVKVIRQSKCERVSLKKFHIRDSSSSGSSFFTETTWDMPNLVSFWTDRCETRLISRRLPNLSSLGLSPITPVVIDCTTWTCILGSMPKLEKLSLASIVLCNPHSDDSLKPVLLRNLHRLGIDQCQAFGGPYNFPVIAAPSLRILNIRACTVEHITKSVSTTKALPHVQSVSLSECTQIDVASASALLSFMRGVCSIHVKQHPYSKIASVLTADHTLLPRLDTIQFSDRVESSSLIHLVKSRIDAGRPLKKIVVPHGDVMEEMRKAFDALNVVLEFTA